MTAELKVKEIRKGRLVMLSMLGYFVQAAVTGQGPVENSASHITDPLAVNGLTLEIATKYTPLCLLPCSQALGRRRRPPPSRWI